MNLLAPFIICETIWHRLTHRHDWNRKPGIGEMVLCSSRIGHHRTVYIRPETATTWHVLDQGRVPVGILDATTCEQLTELLKPYPAASWV